MPKKPATEGAPKKPAEEGVLVAAAKTIGKAAGTVAALAGIETPAPSKSTPTGRLPKKGKTRLPRRQKKAQNRAATATL